MGNRTSPMVAKVKATNLREFKRKYVARPELVSHHALSRMATRMATRTKKPKPYKPTALEIRRLEVSRRRYLLRSAGSDAVFMREELRPLASF